jgi:glycine betaine/proline transport system substrate-binding protein
MTCGAMRFGITHVQIEVWSSSIPQTFSSLVNRKLITDMGKHTAQIREQWWYPQYVESFVLVYLTGKPLHRCASLLSLKGKKGIYYTVLGIIIMPHLFES